MRSRRSCSSCACLVLGLEARHADVLGLASGLLDCEAGEIGEGGPG